MSIPLSTARKTIRDDAVRIGLQSLLQEAEEIAAAYKQHPHAVKACEEELRQAIRLLQDVMFGLRFL